MRLFLLITITLALLSCENSERETLNPIECTSGFVYGIRINLNDSITGEPVSVCDVSYRITEGDYLEDSLRHGGYSCEELRFIVGAGERVGVYDTFIDKEGYEPWESLGVIVGAGECHVVPVVLDAFLVPNN